MSRETTSGWRSLNLDGVVIYPGRPGTAAVRVYSQVFRHCAMEAVCRGGQSVDNQRVIHGITIAHFFRDAIVQSLSAMRELDLLGPVVVGGALLSIDEYLFDSGATYAEPVAPDRPDLVLPEIWVEQFAEVSELDAIARQSLDVLWQAFGYTHCLAFNNDGKLKG